MRYKVSRKKKVDPVNSPCRKVMYNSPEDAQKAIEHIQEDKWVKDLTAYKCSVCGSWHLTRR
jgi:hypothetical protein